jgi:hypothetical protein
VRVARNRLGLKTRSLAYIELVARHGKTIIDLMPAEPNPVYLKENDVMHLGADKLGEQRHWVMVWQHLGERVIP